MIHYDFHRLNIYIKVFLSLLFIILTSCGEKIDETQLKEIASKQFGDPIPISQSQPDTIKFVIDISESMRGFVKSGSFQQLFSKSITSLGPKANIQFFKFDSTLQKENDLYLFFNETTYNKRRAKFETLTSLMDSTSHSIQILLTDFQFNDNQSYLETVKYFQWQLMTGKYIKIFSARPEFTGTIFPQFIFPQKTFISNKPRPLYAIIIADRKYAKFVELLLKEVHVWENSITLSNGSPYQLKIINSNSNLKSNTPNLYLSSKDSLSFKCRIISPVFLEWGEWTTDVVDVQIHSFKDSTFTQEGNVDLKIKEFKKTFDTCIFSFYKKEIDPSTPNLIRIRIKPKNLPEWIWEQSCEGNGNQATKTVKLYDFINAVIKIVNNELTIATEYLFILKE